AASRQKRAGHRRRSRAAPALRRWRPSTPRWCCPLGCGRPARPPFRRAARTRRPRHRRPTVARRLPKPGAAAPRVGSGPGGASVPSTTLGLVSHKNAKATGAMTVGSMYVKCHTGSYTLRDNRDACTTSFTGSEMNFEDHIAELERGAHEVLIAAELVTKLK